MPCSSVSVGPETCEGMLQRFRSADACQGLALCFIYQFIDSPDHARILFLPIAVIFLSLVSEESFHFGNFRSTPLSSFNGAVAESRRLALAGVRMR